MVKPTQDWPQPRRVTEFSQMMWPEKITLDEFIKAVDEHLEPFVDNIKKLPKAMEPKYAEDWFLMFSRWMDIKEG